MNNKKLRNKNRKPQERSASETRTRLQAFLNELEERVLIYGDLGARITGAERIAMKVRLGALDRLNA